MTFQESAGGGASAGASVNTIKDAAAGRPPVCASLAGWIISFAAAMVLYSLTMAPDVVWHDAGYYQWEWARLNLERPGKAVRVHPFFIVLRMRWATSVYGVMQKRQA